jgi:hypothetical protein
MDCDQAATPDPVDLLRDDAAAGASGLGTLTLEIEAFEQKQGVSKFCLAALVDEQRVGFALDLRPAPAPALRVRGHELELPRCELEIVSTGEESDRFVAAVAAVFDLELLVGRMPERLEFHAVCLAGEPSRPQLGPLQLMLVYGGSEPARRGAGEFQWFLRLDLTRREAGFIDRAPENHAAIVAALSGERSWRH